VDSLGVWYQSNEGMPIVGSYGTLAPLWLPGRAPFEIAGADGLTMSAARRAYMSASNGLTGFIASSAANSAGSVFGFGVDGHEFSAPA